MNTDTPRTNDAAFMAIHIDGNGVPTEFARQLERELAAVTDQRDRLVEALKEIYNVSSFDYATMPEPALKKYRKVVLEMADDALKSLTTNEEP
jgi:polyhydroxyalkanoate synthesis regulator protein